MSKELAPWQRAEQSIQKKYRKGIWRPFVTAVNQYELISKGDRIAVCISGGKDSMLMAKLLQMLQRHSEVPFQLVYLVMDPGYNARNREKIVENARLLNVPITVFETNIFEVANSTDRSPCYLCARMRRGFLYSKAKELGCNKIALGHHFSDVIETTVMGMFYGGQLQAMIPKLHSTNFEGMELIRPLYRVHEDDILAWMRYNGLEFIQCACRFTENAAADPSGSKRQEIKNLIRTLKRDNPNIEKSIFNSIHAVSLDTFPGYKTEGEEHSFLERFNAKSKEKENDMSEAMKNPGGKLVTYLKAGTEVAGPVQGAETVLTDAFEIAHSCELSADKPLNYRAALFVNKDGVVSERSVTGALQGGSYDSGAADGVAVTSESDDFSALIADGGRYVLKNAKILMPTKSDGKNVCDFAGLGSSVAAFNRARVDIDNCEIATEGVAKCTVYADNGADVVIRNSRLSAMGGKLYNGYVNSADFNYMVATPWVLGMMGNARGTNIMGEKTTMVLADTDVKVRNWGVLSTDNGEDNVLAVIDSTLTLTGGEEDRNNPYHKTWGSGYGTYILGADEDLRGVTINAGTYVGICRDGNATYRSSRGKVRVASAASGEILYEGEGKGNPSVLNSDGFGIMAHGFGTLILTDDTVMNTENAAFLLRAGGVSIRVSDGAQVNVKDGVLLQVIDDDDATVGVNWHGEKELEFHTEFFEKEGWPSENGQISSMMPPPDPSDMPPPPPPGEEMPEPRFDVRFSAAAAELKGDLYNGSGYYGQGAKQLYITLEKDARLTGAISATETIHVDENGKQNTHFTSEQYYYLGHVANRPFYNGDNAVEVVLESGSAWNVTARGIITSLTVKEGASLKGTVAMGGKTFIPEAGKTYTGEIEVTP